MTKQVAEDIRYHAADQFGQGNADTAAIARNLAGMYGADLAETTETVESELGRHKRFAAWKASH